MWSGTVNALKSHKENSGMAFNLKLKRRESALLFLTEDDLDFSEEEEKNYAELNFVLTDVDDENLVKTYKGTYFGTADNLYIRVWANDMVECFVNGSFCGFSLWNEHKFCISPFLRDGENKIELKIS